MFGIGRMAVVACVAVALAGPMPAMAGDSPEAQRAELQAELHALQSRVKQLRQEQETDWLTERRAGEVRALIQDVLADADTRSALLTDGMTAGWDKGFFIGSADGSFRLRIAGQIQVRHVVNVQSDNRINDSTRYGFEVSRARLGFIGHIIDPTWRFFVWGGWLPNGKSILIDAWVRKDLNDEWSVQVGQFKRPLWKEWLMSETRQQFIERSLLTARYSGLGAEGLVVSYSTDSVHACAAIIDGGRTWNTGWSTGPDQTTGTLPWQQSTEFSVAGRLELLAAGKWAQGNDWESWAGDELMIVFGAAAHYQRGESGTPDQEADIAQWTVDANAKFGGANVFAAVIGTYIDDGTSHRHEWGVLVQGGYFLTEDWEAIARYEYGDLDGAGVIGDELSLLTVGVTRFWNKHGLKLMADVGYGFEPVDPGWAPTGAGWRPDEPGRDGQWVVRTQFQLLF